MDHIGKLLLRVACSLLLMTHGFSKLKKLFSDDIRFSDPLSIGEENSLFLATIGEFVIPLFIIVGYKTRIASFFPAFTMLIAAFVVHFEDPFGKKELAILYLLGFVLIMLFGPGKYSIDHYKKK
ncbi:MAG: DoxX family protein [Flavobacteriales bacterium]|jgi:putative oxidoreductase|tara:strand:- start:132 stop:503 length:372 start_codon:yes stop_codon:yes gene_type:complete